VRSRGACLVATIVLGALGLGAIARARAEGRKRYEGAFFSFAIPDGATAKPGSDVSADAAVSVSSGDGSIIASVLAGARRIADGEIESTAAEWHGARVKNRAAWGMKANGGPPRETVRIAERRWLRWRDRIGSVLGAQEQTMTCGGINGHLGCVVVSAPAKDRETADALAAELIASFKIRR
jgi:hypothetical protein